MAAALSVFSCKVEDGYYYRQLDSDRLEKYAEGIYLSYVCGELDMMMRLLDIDHFISLSPEEQRESPLAGKVFHEDGNTLVIEQVFSEARISTGGKRLLETGAGWTVENFCSDMGCSYLQPSLLYAEVACKGDGVWEILMRTSDSSECAMEITMTSEFPAMKSRPTDIDPYFQIPEMPFHIVSYPVHLISQGLFPSTFTVEVC